MKTPTTSQISKAARMLNSDERVPYAFEKRVMAHLSDRPFSDFWTAWAGTMWRAALSCLAISVLMGAAISYSDPSREELFAADLERTVLAPVDVDDTW